MQHFLCKHQPRCMKCALLNVYCTTLSQCRDLDFRISCCLRTNPPRPMNTKKTSKKKHLEKHDRTQLAALPHPWGLQFCLLVFEGLAKKVAGPNSLPMLPPWSLLTCLGLWNENLAEVSEIFDETNTFWLDSIDSFSSSESCLFQPEENHRE